jgi:hypothetical protein
MMEWRPIETAPRDATPILLYDPHRERKPVYEAWWALEYEGGPGFWMTPMGPAGRGYTILDGKPNSPTHWMPLPDPPLEQHGN